MTMSNILSTAKISSYLKDLLFPRVCLVCSKEGAYICKKSRAALEPSSFPCCPVCARKLIEGRICRRCKKQSGILLSRFFTLFPYRNLHVRTLIMQAKYRPTYAKELIEEGSRFLAQFLAYHKFHDYILPHRVSQKIYLIPIPLHKKKLRSRSFNQAEVIARVIASEFSIPLKDDILLRARATRSQTEINPLERKLNILGAFRVKDSARTDICGKVIILVDDVYTSGSTINECARVLRKSGAKEVWGITLAK